MNKTLLKLLLLFFTATLYGQFDETWNLTIDSYAPNTGILSIKPQPIAISYLSNTELVILTQNGSLLKTDSKGNVIWRKEVGNYHRQQIVVDSFNNIILSQGTKIRKYTSSGQLIWEQRYSSIFRKDYPTFSAIVLDSNDNIYVAGYFYDNHSKQILQANIDSDGEMIWKKTFEQKEIKGEYQLLTPEEIITSDGFLYMVCNNLFTSTIIYKTDLKGEIREEIFVDHEVKSIKEYKGTMYTLGIGYYNGDYNIRMFKLLEGKVKEKVFDYKLPINRTFQRERLVMDSLTNKVKMLYYDIPGVSFRLDDSTFDLKGDIFICGNSNKRMWIIKLDRQGNLVVNWESEDTTFYKFNNTWTQHYQNLSQIDLVDEHIIVAGLSTEEDYQESSFQNKINIFVKELKFDK